MQGVHILYVVRPAEGGMLQHVQQLLNALSSHVRLTVACPEDSWLYRELPQGVERISLPLRDGWTLREDLYAAFQLKEWMACHPVDLLHMHGAKAGFVGRLAARMANDRPPLVYTMHNFIEAGRFWKNSIYLAVERWLSQDTHCYIAVSHGLKNRYVNQIDISEGRIQVIHNGAAPFAGGVTRQEARTFFHIKNNRFVVGTIGRLIEEKGVAILLLAFKELIHRGFAMDLVVMGDGPERSRLQEITEKMDICGHVRFLGQVKDAARFLKGFDVCVIPSLREGFGLVAVEAMLAGVPVIATKVGGLEEIIQNEKTGLLVPPNDPSSLALSIERVYREGERINQMVAAGKEYAAKQFSVEKMVRKTINVYQSCLGEREIVS